MNLTLEQKNEMVESMIRKNCDATIADYLRVLYGGEPPKKEIKKEPVIMTRFSRRIVEPMKDPAPFRRPPAKYDNRGHDKLIEEYS